MKILAIGNSFSQNATELLEILGSDLFVRNLYIPGCSLKMHAENIVNNAKNYEYQENGTPCIDNKISIKDALLKEKWDYITIQQCSGDSGILESYYPYINDLIVYIRKYSKAEIIFHETWTYEDDSTHPCFSLYDNDRSKMYRSLLKATNHVAKHENLKIIRSGEAIEKARKYKAFDKKRGGVNITCDGFHLSSYGKFLVAGIWMKFFNNKIPEYLKTNNLSSQFKVIKKILEKE